MDQEEADQVDRAGEAPVVLNEAALAVPVDPVDLGDPFVVDLEEWEFPRSWRLSTRIGMESFRRRRSSRRATRSGRWTPTAMASCPRRNSGPSRPEADRPRANPETIRPGPSLS